MVATALRVHAWNTGSLGRTLDARPIRRSRLSTLARGADHREARLIPKGIGAARERWLASGWCGLHRRLTAIHTVGVRRSAHLLRSGQPRGLPSPRRGLGRDPEVVAPNRNVEYVSTTDQVVLEARGLLPPERVPAETAAGWKTCGSAFRGPARPEAARFYSSGHTKTRRSGVRFRCSRRSTPSDRSDGHCLISVRRRIAHRRDARPGRSPIEPPRKRGAGLRGGQVHPSAAGAASPPGGGWPANGPGASAWTCKQVSVKPAQGGCGKGTRRTELPR